jgi:hypothetical protein
MEKSESFILTKREQILKGLKISGYPEIGPLGMVLIAQLSPENILIQVAGTRSWLSSNSSAPWRMADRKGRGYMSAHAFDNIAAALHLIVASLEATRRIVALSNEMKMHDG